MAIRDLQYPDDAIKVIDSLVAALRYDASIAALRVRCQSLHPATDGPIDYLRIRASGKHADDAVLRDAPTLLSRFALLQMLSHFEVHAGNLLLQRRVLEHLLPDRRMQPGEMWGILKKVHQESRPGPVKVAYEIVVTSPSPRLSEMRSWLDGLYSVRNCLAHRNGLVALVDVALDKKRLEQTKDSDVLRATWVEASLCVDGKGVDLPYHTEKDVEAQISIKPSTREWAVGEEIDLSPSDVQGICLAMTFLSNELLRCFLFEIDQLVATRGRGT